MASHVTGTEAVNSSSWRLPQVLPVAACFGLVCTCWQLAACCGSLKLPYVVSREVQVGDQKFFLRKNSYALEQRGVGTVPVPGGVQGMWRYGTDMGSEHGGMGWD